jgi:predicted TIM-barrel fold metal-dependent hydrolase
MDDFPRVAKIDAHVHINTTAPGFADVAHEDNVRLLTINTDYADFPPVEEQWRVARELTRMYPDRVAFASTFRMAGWDEPGWREKTIGRLDSTIADGAVAVKFWKNIGMEFRDKDGALVMIDNPRLDPVIDHLRDKGIPVVGHQGEPRDCWSPVDRMRVRDLKEYYGAHPQFHMERHPEMPSYTAHLEARDRMLAKHKDITFMGAHLGSMEWSVDLLAKFLDRFPRAEVDLGARMSQVQYQSTEDREKVRQFFITYQDRIIYATDIAAGPGGDAAELKKALHAQWLSDWKYLCTDSTMTVRDLEKPFQGLRLPRDVVDKVMRLNAEKTFIGAWKRKG